MNRARINVVLLWFFVVNATFVPADPFELKKIALFFLVALNLDVYLKLKTRDEWISVLFGFGLTSLNIVMSWILTGNLFKNIVLGYMGYILILYPVIKHYHINFIKIVHKTLVSLALFIVIMASLDLLKIIPLEANKLLTWLHNSGNAMIGKGSHLPTGYLIFMKASPLLLLCIPYYFVKKKFLTVAFLATALFIAGTRANLFVCFAVLLCCYAYQYIWIEQDQKKKIICITVIAAAALLVMIDGRVINYVLDMFTRKADSDSVRHGTLVSILELWKNDPFRFFIGSGFSSEFYNSGIGAMSSNVELSYWNLLRQVGLLSFLLMMLMYLWPIYALVRERKHIIFVLGYLAYLVVAYTNPLLYSSTGILAVLYMYCLRNQLIHKQKNCGG